MLPERTSLMQAILAVQAEAPPLPKDKTNPHFGSKFTGLETITVKLLPILQKHGLVWLTFPGRDENGQPALRYSLIHAETGEADGDTMPLLLGKGDMQSFGSAVTYARRYALCAVLGLVADEDDDGNAATAAASAGPRRVPQGIGAKPTDKQKAFLKKIVEGKAHGVTTPTRKQLTAMLAEIDGAPLLGEGWVDKLEMGHMKLLLDRCTNGDLPPDEGPPASDVPNEFPGAMVPEPKDPQVHDFDDMPFSA
jgi:hypothetical protein